MTPEGEILDHVATLLDEAGEGGFTMASLAERTGLSRTTLYRRYGGRAALLQRLATRRGLDLAALDPPDARTRIMQAAHDVYGAVGLEAATIGDVAVAAGVGPATVYRHFGSREGLIKAFIGSIRPAAAIADLQRYANEPPVIGLTRFATDLLQVMVAERSLLRLFLAQTPATLRWLNELRLAPERTHSLLSDYLKAQIEAGQLRPADPDSLAIAFIGMLFVFSTINPFFRGDPAVDLDPEATAAFVTDLFLRGARPPGSLE